MRNEQAALAGAGACAGGLQTAREDGESERPSSDEGGAGTVDDDGDDRQGEGAAAPQKKKRGDASLLQEVRLTFHAAMHAARAQCSDRVMVLWLVA